MKPLTSEWLVKAEEDYRVARREERARPPAYSAACFHAQQCVEKCFKGLLAEQGVAFPKTHDLEALMRLCLPALPRLEAHWEPLQWLTSFAVEVRYPGTRAKRADARRSVQIATAIRGEVRRRLGVKASR